MAKVRTLEEQYADNAGDLDSDDLETIGLPAGPSANRGEVVAPDPPDDTIIPPETLPDPKETPGVPKADAPAIETPATATPPATESTPPATPAQKKYAGKFDTEAELEAAYAQSERHITELSEGQKRLEGLIRGLQQPRETMPETTPRSAHPVVEPTRAAVTPEQVTKAWDAHDAYHSKLALGETPTTDERKAYIEGQKLLLIHEGKLADEITEPVTSAAQRRIQDQQARVNRDQAIETKFFTKFPELKTVPRSLLMPLVKETADQLNADPASRELTPEQWDDKWLERTGTSAKAIFRFADAPTNGAAHETPAPATPALTVKPVPTGARSEGPGGITPAPPRLTDQEKEIADLHTSGFFDPV